MAPFLGTACFSDLVVVPEGGAIPVASEIPFDALATIGCAVITGVGAVTNAGQVPKGSRVAVIGAGGVGLNVVQGAAIAGCERIIAIDLRPRPLELARQFGATDAVGGATWPEVLSRRLRISRAEAERRVAAATYPRDVDRPSA